MKQNLLICILGVLLLNTTLVKAAKIIQLKGSDTIVNMSQYIVEKYMEENKGERIAVTGGGSGVGISSLINGTIDIAMSSRKIKEKEEIAANKKNRDIKEIVLGYDGITIIVNDKNPINDLSVEELSQIYRGEITNWKELGGKDSPIVILSRDSSSGTHEFFKEYVIREENKNKDAEYAKQTLYMPSSEAIKQEVKINENAIGYIGLGYVDKTVKDIKINSVEASVENISEKKYPISREVYWYVGETGNESIDRLVDFALSEKGQKIVVEEGFVPEKK